LPACGADAAIARFAALRPATADFAPDEIGTGRAVDHPLRRFRFALAFALTERLPATPGRVETGPDPYAAAGTRLDHVFPEQGRWRVTQARTRLDFGDVRSLVFCIRLELCVHLAVRPSVRVSTNAARTTFIHPV